MSEFILKTPEKAQNRREFSSSYKGILSTAHSENKTPIPWYFHSENSRYDSKFRQFPNVFPWIYRQTSKKSTLNSQKLKNEEINYQNENISYILEQSIQKIEKNDTEIENLRQNLAYQPDFHISSLFLLIAGEKQIISIEDLAIFYRD